MSFKANSAVDLSLKQKDKIVIVLSGNQEDAKYVEVAKDQVNKGNTVIIVTSHPQQDHFKKIEGLTVIKIGNFIPTSSFYYFESILDKFRCIYMLIWCLTLLLKLEPTCVITDNEYLCNKKLQSWMKFTIIPVEKMLQKPKKRNRSMIRLTRTDSDHEIYEQEFYDIRTLVNDLPEECKFFCTFGEYTPEYNFEIVLRAFYYFMEKNETRMPKSTFLIIGGTFDSTSEFHEKIYDTLRYSYDFGFYGCNVKLLKNLTKPQKRAILIHSYAFIHANTSEKNNDDVKMALSLGTPVITAEQSCAEEIIVFSITGYVIPLLAKKFATYMDNVTYKEKDMNYFSKRLYLKKFKKTKNTLKQFYEEDNI